MMCWGWGTWRRGWEKYNSNGKALLDGLRSRNLLWKFNFEGATDYKQMLTNSISGYNDSWAIKWYASAILNDMITLYPKESLVSNIGNDGSGVHSAKSNRFDVDLDSTVIDTSDIKIEENLEARRQFRNYLISQHPNLVKWRVRMYFNWISYALKRIYKAIHIG